MRSLPEACKDQTRRGARLLEAREDQNLMLWVNEITRPRPAM